MNENIKNKLNIEVEINNYLLDLKNYAEGAYYYLTNNPLITDKEEIISCLEAVPEIIEIIEKLIKELEAIYENE